MLSVSFPAVLTRECVSMDVSGMCIALSVGKSGSGGTLAAAPVACHAFPGTEYLGHGQEYWRAHELLLLHAVNTPVRLPVAG